MHLKQTTAQDSGGLFAYDEKIFLKKLRKQAGIAQFTSNMSLTANLRKEAVHAA